MCSFGFSTSLVMWSPSSTATPNRSGSGTLARKICADGRWRSTCSTNDFSPSSRTLSPRYMTNGSSPTNSSAVSTAWARPSGADCGMYVTRSPQVEPSPTASRTSSAVCPTTMPTSSIPASAMARSAWNRIGVLAIGMSCLALVWVMGRSRDPSPPERTSAFMASAGRGLRTAARLRRGRDRVAGVVRGHDDGDLVPLQVAALVTHLGNLAQVALHDVRRGLALRGRGEHDRRPVDAVPVGRLDAVVQEPGLGQQIVDLLGDAVRRGVHGVD